MAIVGFVCCRNGTVSLTYLCHVFPSSSSYSSDALDFETEHRLDPVFDSPRMSRRSLRLAATTRGTEGGQAGHADACPSSTASLRDRAAR